jgi:hypothetical protein
MLAPGMACRQEWPDVLGPQVTNPGGYRRSVIRLQLEPLGWFPLCNGARLDCYPSAMARDMGAGRAVYVLVQTLDKLALVTSPQCRFAH